MLDNLALDADDVVMGTRLDRLARSMKELIETIETLRVRGIGFRSLTEALDTTTLHLWLRWRSPRPPAEMKERSPFLIEMRYARTTGPRWVCEGLLSPILELE
jgi:Resolvase, N terminal domain